jgi:hypothetical protein
MKIVEYKKHKINGQIDTPEFIEFGGFFFNPTNNTYIGVISEDDDREYYVPDSLNVLTKEELIDRQSSINDGSISDVDRWYNQFILRLK